MEAISDCEHSTGRRTGRLRRGATAAALVMMLATAARADIVPTPPPECNGKPDGTPCALYNGTAGKCTTKADSRRPGRSWVVCEQDAHECDQLQIGAPCRGYLGKPAHCKEFTSVENKTTWRTCQVDGADAPPAPPAGPDQPPAPKKKGLLSCQAAPFGAAAGAGPLALCAAALIAAARRRRPRH